VDWLVCTPRADALLALSRLLAPAQQSRWQPPRRFA
jgi:hypothetical protein